MKLKPIIAYAVVTVDNNFEYADYFVENEYAGFECPACNESNAIAVYENIKLAKKMLGNASFPEKYRIIKIRITSIK